jgi:hypothetical protein
MSEIGKLNVIILDAFCQRHHFRCLRDDTGGSTKISQFHMRSNTVLLGYLECDSVIN